MALKNIYVWRLNSTVLYIVLAPKQS